MIDFSDINYLKTGNASQQRVYNVISENGLFDVLSNFSPVLAGTFPIGIDIESSDLDILCCWQEKEEFAAVLKKHFSGIPGFQMREMLVHAQQTVIASFRMDHFDIEIFGQQVPVQQQYGYRHLIIEHILLEKLGESFRLEIIALKRQGFKTEPAFARLLQLSGDPYQALLAYEVNKNVE